MWQTLISHTSLHFIRSVSSGPGLKTSNKSIALKMSWSLNTEVSRWSEGHLQTSAAARNESPHHSLMVIYAGFSGSVIIIAVWCCLALQISSPRPKWTLHMHTTPNHAVGEESGQCCSHIKLLCIIRRAVAYFPCVLWFEGCVYQGWMWGSTIADQLSVNDNVSR